MIPSMKEKKIYWTFILTAGFVVVFVLAGVFIDLTVRMKDFANEANISRARGYYRLFLSAWQWNARSRTAAAGSGVRGQRAADHALVSRDMMDAAGKEGGVQCRVVSLEPAGARTRPDNFEEDALSRFLQGGSREAYTTALDGTRMQFRYLAPLTAEQPCFACHAWKNGAAGSVVGGISVSFDIEGQRAELRNNMATIAVFGTASAVLLAGILLWFAVQLMKRLSEARVQIEKITIMDDLTGVHNRKYVMSRFNEEYEQARRLKGHLSCIIADIDHFKTVNDLYGHIAGDEVLKAVGQAFKGLVRAYDIVGRYGGEEFLFVLPDTSIEQAWHFAERVRMHVRGQAMAERQITISMGVTGREDNDQSIDDMIRRADDALFRAKEAGRDRVAWLPEEE